jgi:hypothetical protein
MYQVQDLKCCNAIDIASEGVGVLLTVADSGPSFRAAAPSLAQRYVYQLGWKIFLSVSNFIGFSVLPYQNITSYCYHPVVNLLPGGLEEIFIYQHA